MGLQTPYYPPDVAVKAIIELTVALKDDNDPEYANALLADPRMTNTKGMLASCGLSYKEIKKVRHSVNGNLPLLDEQKRAIEFLNNLEHEMQVVA